MYSEIEEEIVSALRQEFKDDPFLKPEMIIPAILLKNPKEEVPPHLPAIRVVFTDMIVEGLHSIERENYEVKLKYSVFFFFKTFFYSLGNQSFNAYTYLRRITSSLKNLRTSKGILGIESISLLGGDDFFAYSVECEVESII